MLLLLTGCVDHKHYSEADLQEYVLTEDNGLTKIYESGEAKIVVTYRPTDLLVAQELGNVSNYSIEEIQALRNKYGQYAYFILSISSGNKEALYSGNLAYEQFSNLVQNLAFRLDQYANLTTSASDTIPVADFVFPRTYGAGSATSLMAVFNKQDFTKSKWVQFNLKEMGLGLGNRKFRFVTQDIESAPNIDFSHYIRPPDQNTPVTPLSYRKPDTK